MPASSSRLLRLRPSLCLLIAFFASTSAFGQVRSTADGGLWDEPSTWEGGAVPASTDEVVIASGAEVTFDLAQQCGGLIVESGGVLSSSANFMLTVTGEVVNEGGILGESAFLRADGDVTNDGTWSMKLFFGGTATRTVDAPAVTGDVWVVDDITLEGENVLSRLDAFESGDGTMLIPAGATLRLTQPPEQGYSPAGLGFPDEEELQSLGTIEVANIPAQFNNVVVGSDLVASLSAADENTLTVETHSDEPHPAFPNSIEQWYRFDWSDGEASHPDFFALGLIFTEAQLNGVDPSDLYVYHSGDGGANWTQITTNAFEVFYDAGSGQGFTNLTNVASAGDYVIAGPGGPQNAPPIALDDMEFGMQSQDVVIDVLANDYDPEGGAISLFSAQDGSQGGTSIVDGMVVYSPSPGASGVDTFTYVITDDQGAEASAQVTVRIADSAIALFDQVVSGEQPGETDEVVRRRTVSINFGHLDNLLAGESGSLALNLFEDETVILDAAGSTTWSDTERSWMGGSDRFGDWVTLEYDSQSQFLFATAWSAGTPYRIERTPGGNYSVQELDLSGLSDEGDLTGDSQVPEGDREISVQNIFEVPSPSGSPAAEDGPPGKRISTEFDLLILYTEEARDSSGSDTSMRQEIYNAVNNTNQTYRNSGANVRARLAGTALVQYNEEDSAKDDLGNLTSEGRRSGSDVSNLRDQLSADIVGLVTSNLGEGTCGRAHIMKKLDFTYADDAFFVVKQGNCLGGNLSFAHEIGHIQGARHDRAVDPTDGSPVDFNHGYVNPPNGWTGMDDQWRTVMAYNKACDCSDETSPCPDDDDRMTNGPFCDRLMWWSNPNNTWTGGNVMGVASGSNAADNVRLINTTAPFVSVFRGGASPEVRGTITDVSTGAGLQGVRVVGSSTSETFETLSDATGFYSLVIPSGTELVVEVELEGYAFDPPFVDLSTITSDAVQDFTATPQYTVSGTISANGTPLRDVEIRGGPGTTSRTNSQGDYELILPWDWTGTLTPVHPAYRFVPPNVTFTSLQKDTTKFFVAFLKRHEISGVVETLSGEGIPDVTMQGLPDDPVTDSDGAYSVVVDHGWAGTATPVRLGYSFEPLSREYVGVTGDRRHDYDAYAGGLARSEWPMWAASALHRSRLDIATFSNQKEWDTSLSGSMQPPVVGQDGTIYVATDTHLHAVDQDGVPLWDIPLPGAAGASPAVGTANRILVPSGSQLIAYDVSDQSQVWAFDTEGTIESPPAIDREGVIYVGSNSDSLFAVSAEGDRLWAFDAGDDVRTSPAVTSSGTVYFGSEDGSVYAVNSDGNQLWTYAAGGAVRSSPSIGPDGSIFVGTDADALISIDPDTGSRNWRFAADGDVRGTPALDTDGNAYFGTSAGTFYAVTPDGALGWSYDALAPISGSAAVSFTRVRQLTSSGSDEEVVYVSTDSGTTYAFNIRTPSGFSDRMRWQFAGPDTAPVLSEHGLLAGDAGPSSTLYALEPESRALTQISVLLNDFGGDFDPDQVAAILWLEEQGGPLALLPELTDDPCTGGPLIIPDCPITGTFGGASPLTVVQAGRDILLGLAEFTDALEEVIQGTSEQGLLGTFPVTFEDEDVSALAIGGLVDPSGYAPNPEGLSTELSLFQQDVDRSVVTDPESVYLMSGNMSTDASALSFTLTGEEPVSFSDLSFGDLSEIVAVSEGLYDVSLLEDIPGKRRGNTLRQMTLDLNGRAGEIVTLYARGFMDPSANNGGPPIGVEARTGSGETLVGGVRNEKDDVLPDQIGITAVYPNPISGHATVEVSVPALRQIRVELYDVLGRRVDTLVEGAATTGTRRLRLDASELGSGVYVLRLFSEERVQSRTITIVR